MSNTRPAAAATDVAELIQSMDAGQFELAVSTAISQVAAAVADLDKPGKVKLEFMFKKLPGAAMVAIEHSLEFKAPTEDGTRAETMNRRTTFHVAKGGKLTLTPENQLALPGLAAAAKA